MKFINDIIATRLLFFIMAFYVGLWTIRIPTIKDQITTDYFGIGLIMATFAIGFNNCNGFFKQDNKTYFLQNSAFVYKYFASFTLVASPICSFCKYFHGFIFYFWSYLWQF